MNSKGNLVNVDCNESSQPIEAPWNAAHRKTGWWFLGARIVGRCIGSLPMYAIAQKEGAKTRFKLGLKMHTEVERRQPLADQLSDSTI